MPAKSRAATTFPAGTVTFLFTDIEGSAKLWEERPEAMQVALVRHDALMGEAITGADGHVFKTVGGAFCAAFAVASDAVAAALAAQRAVAAEPWPAAAPIRVRMALHTGAAQLRDGDYFGPVLNRVARLLPSAHGGQTLLSQAACELCRDALPDGATLRDLGVHQLRDLERPEQVHELRHADLPRDFPPIRSLSTHPNNLPRQLSTFIGREAAIADIEALLLGSRVLTLTGTGGCGKTRLCLQVAAGVLEQYPDGAWFAELAGLSDPGLVPQTVAMALGVAEDPGRPITQTIVDSIKHKRLLLLVDNCEHLLEACAAIVDVLARHCPGATIMATSREALGIEGEQAFHVRSMALPDRGQAPSPQELSRFESVQLFVDRASLVRPEFEVNTHNAPALASLCRHLDGIPLAIELAAARVRSLSIEEIDGKLDQRFRLLTGGARTALPRQQTLRSLIDWSYNLLHEPEQRLLQRLSVFAGGWTLIAAEAICSGDGVAEEEILERLTSLADKSLAVAEQTNGGTRYRLLETVRQYARDRLMESGGGDSVRRRHRDHFLALAEEAEPKLRGSQQAVWLRRLGDEYDNLRSALESSVAEAGSQGGLRLCGALQRFWWARGYLSEGREWCMRILGKAGAEARTPERAKSLNAAGVLAYNQSDYPAARALNEESLAIQRELADRWGMANSLNNLGNVAWDQGDYPAAKALHEQSLAFMRELGDRWGIARSLTNLGNVAWEQVDYPAARALHEESLAIMRELGDRSVICASLFNLGIVAHAQHDLPAAEALYEESLAIEREMGLQQSIANSQITLGNLAMERGDFAAARARHEEALAIGRELGDKRAIAMALEGSAAVVAALGDPLRAARVWGAAERLRTEVGSPQLPQDQPDYDRWVAAARAALGDDAAFDRAWGEGRALALEQAMELALEDPGITR